MEHFTSFELVLIGASIATLAYGYNIFVKKIFMKEFRHRKA